MTKGSITSKNFELFLTNLTHSKKPSYLKFVAEERGAFLPKKMITCKYRFARSRERPIHYFKVSTGPAKNIDGIITVKF